MAGKNKNMAYSLDKIKMRCPECNELVKRILNPLKAKICISDFTNETWICLKHGKLKEVVASFK